MAGVDFLIAQGITDPDRMVIGGWSFGGFMTSWAVTHTDRFKAGMVGAGVTDLYSMATTTDISPSFSSGYFGPLAGNFDLYDKHSPVRYVADCHTPVLAGVLSWASLPGERCRHDYLSARATHLCRARTPDRLPHPHPQLV
jgi:hypothetical protein